MCGIAGFADLRKRWNGENLAAVVSDMERSLRHRGPDGHGSWVDPGLGIAFGHCRLAIIDVSEKGKQPMDSFSGRFVITYNGEVYNFREIREELLEKGVGFNGCSDTEVVLNSIETWGLDDAIHRFNGMFAFVLFDRKERKMFLVRDRLGIKPLFYSWAEGVLMFASEVKAFRRHPLWENAIDRNVLAQYLKSGYVPAPFSIYRNTFKLWPGSVLEVDLDDKHTVESFSPFPCGPEGPICRTQPKPYWDLRNTFREGSQSPFPGSEKEASEEMDEKLKDAVSCRMIADVPLGAFLSGGIDSSLIVSQMASVSNRPVQTFSVGFEDDRFDEAPYGKRVAAFLGAEHQELYVTPKDALALIPRLPSLYDEPFSDPSQIPTCLVARFARRSVTVCLSGDGGDENFGGYRRYILAPRVFSRLRNLPLFARKLAKILLEGVPLKYWEVFVQAFSRVLPEGLKSREVADSLYKFSNLLPLQSQEEIFSMLTSCWSNPNRVVLGPGNGHEKTAVRGTGSGQGFSMDDRGFVRNMMYSDIRSYLPDNILVKVDRASMGVGLEVRVPFLDHRLVEFAARLPMEFLIHNGQGKRILRRKLDRQFPKDLFNRPKKGFGVPLGRWLRGPLSGWAEDMLDESKLKREGFFDHQVLGRIWREHKARKRDWKGQLWAVICFESWLDAN